MPLSKASRAEASYVSIQLPFFFLFDGLLTLDAVAADWDATTTGEGILVNLVAFSSEHVAAPEPGMSSMGGLPPPSPIASLPDLLRREEVGIGLSLVTKRTKAPVLLAPLTSPPYPLVAWPCSLGSPPPMPLRCSPPHLPTTAQPLVDAANGLIFRSQPREWPVHHLQMRNSMFHRPATPHSQDL
jgi:hypothetical protein